MSLNFSFIDESEKYFHPDDKCRFCSNKPATISLQSGPATKSEVLLLENIQFCLGIELQLENPPKTICELCKVKMENFAYFKKLCLDSEESLQRIIKTENTEADIKPYNSLKCVGVGMSGDFNVNEDSNNYLESNCDISHSSSESALNNVYEDNVLVTELTINKTTNLECKKPKKNICKPKTKKYYKPKKTKSYCLICHTDFGNEENYIKHNMDCHGIEEDGLYRCLGCERKFKTSKSRVSHEINFCKGLKDGYKCTVCERFMPARGMYVRHMRAHLNNVNVELSEYIFKCKKCPKSFKTKDCLKTHLESHVKKQYICETCGRVFTRNDYLHIHKKTHTGARQYKCPHCDYRATQKSSLNVHIRKHTGERPYSCDICSQRCVNKSNLMAHLKRHAGVKSYECTICHKKFGYKSSLDDHVSSTHERSSQHVCRVCGALYTRLNGLRRHLLAKHGKKMQKSILVGADSEDTKSMDFNKDFVDKIIITHGDKDVFMKIVASDKIEGLKGDYVVKGDQIFVVNSDISCKNT